MNTVIASHIPGRSIYAYDLLDEVIERYGLDRREAHESIHQLLDDLVTVDGRDAVILGEQPMRPELVEHNPQDLDIYRWITITDEAADAIRGAMAATYASA